MIKALPNRIRAFRERAGLSMQALAERAGTSAPQINKLEKGDRKLTVDWMIRLGRALGADPKDLMVIESGRGGASITTSRHRSMPQRSSSANPICLS
jgi:transcriptional regulator with XRE-family HTH domain